MGRCLARTIPPPHRRELRTVRSSIWCDGGFALHEAFLRRVAGVSDPRVVQFPPIGGGAGVVCGGVATKVQTHWAKIAENVLFWLNGSALWRNWRVWTHRLRYSALRARRMRVGSGSWAPLLAALTR